MGGKAKKQLKKFETDRHVKPLLKKQHEDLSGKTQYKEAKKMQKKQDSLIAAQRQREKTRLMESESDVEKRKFKMSQASQYGRSSLLGG